MTAFAQTMAVPTTQLTRVVPYEHTASRQLEINVEHKYPRMSWVVITGKDRRQLRILWR